MISVCVSGSLSSWRAWIEMPAARRPSRRGCSRSPHGERGLKSRAIRPRPFPDKSLSSWRAWIEITPTSRAAEIQLSLSSWRAWIEMKTGRMPPTPATCRSPHGERGLKYDSHGAAQDHRRSLSSWRAWIEIGRCRLCCASLVCRSPHGERGLKYAGQPDPRPHPRRSPHGERGLK